MPEDINKDYVQRQISLALTTDNEAIKNNCLYRVGTHMEVIPCDGSDALTPEQKQVVLAAVQKLGILD